jgi:coenzyme F420-0:L-glutamate ligase / coenzyme F420-1:gamma-L-glutamate ligase
MSQLRVLPVEGLPEIESGANLGELIAAGAEPREGDVVVIAQKVVSKAEGRVRRLSAAIPGAEARRLAATLGKEPALVQLILDESREVLRAERGVLIAETNGGWICANAGIDSSNVAGDGTVALLPRDADASARRIRAELGAAGGCRPAVVIADSFGRPWRVGQTDVAIGCAGLTPIDDWRGRADAHGRTLAATAIAIGDQLAAATDLARDKASGTPAAIVHGAGRWRIEDDGPGAAAALQRSAEDDLFR